MRCLPVPSTSRRMPRVPSRASNSPSGRSFPNFRTSTPNLPAGMSTTFANSHSHVQGLRKWRPSGSTSSWMPLYSGPGARIASGGRSLPVFFRRMAICPFSGSIRQPYHTHMDSTSTTASAMYAPVNLFIMPQII